MKARRKIKQVITSVGLCVLLTGLNGAIAQNAATAFPVPEKWPAPELVQGLPDFTALVESAGASVVNIRTMARVGGSAGAEFGEMPPEMQEFFEFFFDSPQGRGHPRIPRSRDENSAELKPSGVASGFIVTHDGYILTNAHVVERADEIIIMLPNSQREYQAKVVGADKRTDVALLKIEDVSNLPVVRIGDVHSLKVGEWVVAIGSPFGLDNTVTAGIVSAKQRDTGDYVNFIQTDVAVNPGNSGGPLLNMRGEVVGINSQIYSRSGGFMGISFSIPIDEAMNVAEQLRDQGFVERGRIGVVIMPVTSDVAQALGLGNEGYGALIHSVEKDSVAQKAGIKPGDIITEVSGKKIVTPKDLQRTIGHIKPGNDVQVKLFRQGSWEEVTVKVDAIAEEKPSLPSQGQESPSLDAARTVDMLGVSVVNLTQAQMTSLGVDSGVRVESVNSEARRFGIKIDDVILEVNNTKVTDVAHFESLLGKVPSKQKTVLLVYRGNGVAYIVVPTREK
ncbi:MAG: Do family serine endopeptidase [Saezia sp.]